MKYDRTQLKYNRAQLRVAAYNRGDHGFEQMGRRLGVSRITAYRLWTGRGEPKATTAAAVHREYGITAAELVERVAA